MEILNGKGQKNERQREKGQVEFVVGGILREIEQQEMAATFENMGRPEKITVAEVREQTDFLEAPKVSETLKEIMSAAEKYAEENEASMVEGLEHQLGAYEAQIEEETDASAKEALVERAAWNSVLIEGINEAQADEALLAA